MSVTSGLVPVSGGFSQSISAGSRKAAGGAPVKRRQFRLKIAIAESYGSPQARKVLALSRLADIVAMRDALVRVGRGAQAEFLMRKAGAVADDPEKFSFAIAAANVVMTRPSETASEASTRFVTWGQLARAWGSQELARLYPNAGYGKKSAEATDEPRIEYLCKFIENVPLATFNDDDYWRAMRPARARCKTDSTFKAYAQVARRVLKIAVELRIVPAWPLSAVCKLPLVAKGEAPEFPFLYPEEYCRLMRCALVPIQYRVLWGFIIREGLRLGEAFRIRWEHLAFMPEQNGMRARWVLNVPETKTGRALMFVLSAGTGEVLEAFKRLRPELAGPFAWLSPTQLKKAADNLRRHVEQSGTTRERLLVTDGRLRRLREHDLRSTYVSSSKLAGIDNETIAQHTGHESNTMIARYNRSKQTIEHLGLAPYLPLDQAMGLDVAGDLAATPELGPETAAPQLGEGEGEPLQAIVIDNAGATAPAPLLVSSQAELDALYGVGQFRFPSGAVTSPLQQSGEPANAWRPCCGSCGQAFPSGPGEYTATCPACGVAWDGSELPSEPAPAAAPPAPQRGSAGRRGRSSGLGGRRRRGFSPPGSASNPVQKSDAAAREIPAVPHRTPEGGAIELLLDRALAELEPLNGCNRRDASRDAGSGEGYAPVPPNGETSMIHAECAREGSNLHSRGNRNLNPSPSNGNGQNPANAGGDAAPERTGSDRASRSAVTLLEQLETSARVALRERNWTALRALEPLIDAEHARLRPAPPAADHFAERVFEPAPPVRLELVRAARKGGAS
jgi:integrase